MGKNKALVALGHLILRIIYQVLLTKSLYIEIGGEHLTKYEQQREHKLIKSLESKGYIISK